MVQGQKENCILYLTVLSVNLINLQHMLLSTSILKRDTSIQVQKNHIKYTENLLQVLGTNFDVYISSFYHYHCVDTIVSPREYDPPTSKCFSTDMVY